MRFDTVNAQNALGVISLDISLYRLLYLNLFIRLIYFISIIAIDLL